MARSGQCLCGAVRFELNTDIKEAAACHCGMCRRFSGGVFISVQVPPGALQVTSDAQPCIYRSSDWAERGFCPTCGSSLFYRVTTPGPYQGVCYVAMGSLDDAGGLPLTGEIYIDRKPDGYAFKGDHHTMTEADVMAMFAPPEA